MLYTKLIMTQREVGFLSRNPISEAEYPTLEKIGMLANLLVTIFKAVIRIYIIAKFPI